MDIKSQLKRLKDNWLIAIIVLVFIFIAGSFNFTIPTTFDLMGRGMGGEEYALDGKASSMMAPAPYGSGGFAPEISERVLTRSAYLNTEVRRGGFQEADKELKDIVKSTDSFLLNENVTKSDSRFRQYYSGSYSIRVETSKYAAVTSQLKEIGEVQAFSESTDDITDGYTKVEIELASQKEQLIRYEALYNQATSVEDKLALSDRIYNQERTIKYYEDLFADLDATVEYSSVSVQLNEKHSDYAGIKFVSFGELVNNIVQGINNLLTLIFFLLPYGILGWLIYYGYRWLKRSRK